MPRVSPSCRTDGDSGSFGGSMDSTSWCTNSAGHRGSATFCGACSVHQPPSTSSCVQCPALPLRADAPGADHQASTHGKKESPGSRQRSDPGQPECHQQVLPPHIRSHQCPLPRLALHSHSPPCVQRPTSHGRARIAKGCHGVAAAG